MMRVSVILRLNVNLRAQAFSTTRGCEGKSVWFVVRYRVDSFLFMVHA